jgi:protein involved in polysaccharide export with SLBB domain
VQTDQGITQRGITTQLPVVSPALEGTVSADEYYVGPSDYFSVNIWTSPPLSFTLSVTPEGTLIVPTVGEIRVSDLTLAEAKKRVIADIKKKYLTGNPTVTLISPRRIVVTVTGTVRFPGKYTVNATDRVEKAVEEANVGQRENKGEYRLDLDVQPEERAQSRRNIILRRRNGETFSIDILKYYATKENRWNMLLCEGDEIFVPRADKHKNVIGVYGGVNTPNRFEYVQGDSASDAIRLAYGFSTRAFRDSILIFRFDKNQENIVPIFLGNVFNDRSKDIPLLPGDRVFVKEGPELREDFRVFVFGEVRFPGTYPISKERTRLSELIRLAGGFTQFASLKRSEVRRRSVAPEEIVLDIMFSMRGSVSGEDSVNYLRETELRLQREIVNVDFEQLFLKADSSQDIFLRNGDNIVIPSSQRTVYVFGAVVSPGSVPFASGLGLDYYIRSAGGYTEYAREGDVVIVKSATRQWLAPSETIIEEGDFVWVPRYPDRPTSYYINVFAQAASIISVALSLLLLALQLK